MFLAEIGVEESGLDRLIKCSYTLLGLISFLTYGKDECRAWTIKKGTKAPQAAGKIHSDIERGFIRAEVIAYSDMEACGSVAAARATMTPGRRRLRTRSRFPSIDVSLPLLSPSRRGAGKPLFYYTRKPSKKVETIC